MKVVGGPHDGLNVMVAPSRAAIHLLNPLEQSAIDTLCSECGRVTVETSYTVYTVRTFSSASGPDGKIDHYDFLAPQEWSDMQALRHQFSK